MNQIIIQHKISVLKNYIHLQRRIQNLKMNALGIKIQATVKIAVVDFLISSCPQ